MSFDKFFPTQHEAEQLAALVPKNQSNPLPVRDFLQQLVLFCERQDVRNFLFNPDPIHLPHLSNAQLAKHAVTGKLISTKVENNSTRYFSDHLTSCFLMTPIFAFDKLNFGFGVHEFVFNPAAFWGTLNPGFFGRATSRFVRDDVLGIMVVVVDFPETDVVQVDLTQMLNTTAQIHSIARFRRRELHQLYKSGSFDLCDLIGVVQMFHGSYQFRNCAICKSSHPGCGCTLPRTPMKHPFDINAFYSNMTQRLGTFQGPLTTTIFQNGRQILATTLGSRCSIVGGIDVSLIERLQKWAICERGLADNPRQSLLTFDAANNASGLLSDPLDDIGNHAAFQDDVLLPDLNDDWFANPSGAQALATVETVEEIVADQQENPCVHSLQNGRGQTNLTVEVTDVSQGATTPEQRESTSEGLTSPSGSREGSKTSSKSSSDDRELVKKLRTELRKERNRASAQRSNLRKKAENDARKLEIKTNNEKAALLRAKELTLRQENMRLRQQLAEQSEAKP